MQLTFASCAKPLHQILGNSEARQPIEDAAIHSEQWLQEYWQLENSKSPAMSNLNKQVNV